MTSTGESAHDDTDTRAGAANVAPPSSDAAKLPSRQLSRALTRRSTISTPSTPVLFTARLMTRRASTSTGLDPTTTPGRFQLVPRSADEVTTTDPPPLCRHAKYSLSRKSPLEASTASADN